MAMRLNPYLGFRDNAREAMRFYHSVFGGELQIKTLAELRPDADPADADRVVHALLVTPDGFTLMASDSPNPDSYQPPRGISISLSGEDEERLRGFWERLSEGGEVETPLGEVPWGATFGICVDRFGIRWLVNIEAPAG
jgi:PhnB protein